MQLENLTPEQFIRDFKDTLHQEQLIKVAKGNCQMVGLVQQEMFGKLVKTMIL